MKSLIALALLAAACGGADSKQQDPAQRSTTATDGARLTADGHLALPVGLLGEPFLLQGTYAVDEQLDSASVLRGRVVRFVRADDGALALVEREYEDTPDGPQTVLARFGNPPEREGRYDIDFVAGFERLLLDFAVYEWWDAPDVIVAEIRDVVLVDSVQDDATLFWDTTTTAHLEGVGDASARLTYDLSPYRPPQGFDARQNNAGKSFFENRPVAPSEGVDPISYVHRHDLRHGLSFVLTDNTPPEHEREIALALAYWNGIFEQLDLGRPLTLAEQRADRNAYLLATSVIAWDEEPSHGAARAQSVTDPRTGRIVRSVVVATPLFTQVATEAIEAERSIAALERGHEPAALPDSRLEQMISDYFVNAYVHEIGHALGLRHNFGASLSATVEPSDLRSRFLAYVDGNVPRDSILASSVMEYVPALSAIMTGARVAAGGAALEYDVAVMDALYGAGSGDVGVTCEAEVADDFADCAEFDDGAEPIVGWAWQAERAVQTAALSLARANDVEAAQALEQDGLIVGTLLASGAQSLQSDAEFLSLRADYPSVMLEADQADYRQRVRTLQARWLADDALPLAFVFRDLARGNADERTADRIVEHMLERVERYADLLGVEPDTTRLEVGASAFVQGLHAGIRPALTADYVQQARP